MSGASAEATVPSWVSMSPKFFWTTEMVAPFVAAQALATLVMAGARFASVQMTIVGPALWEATADDASTAATAVAAPSSAHMRLRFCIPALLRFVGTTDTGQLGAGTAASVDPTGR